MPRFPLRTLTSIYFRIGNSTFGGDPALAALQRELVNRRAVVSPEQYGVLYALSRLTPGTNMLAFCAGSGWLLSGWPGAIAAVAAVTLLSAVIAVVLLQAFEILMHHRIPASAIASMVAAAVGLMFAAALLLIRPHVTRTRAFRTLTIAVAAFLSIWMRWLSPVQVIGAAVVIGMMWPEPAAQ